MHPNFGTSYLRILKDLQRSFASKTTMRSLSIIKDSIFLYHLLCLGWIFKKVSTQAFVSEFAMKAFKVTVLPGATFLSEFMAYTLFLDKLLEANTPEFRSLVCSDNSWQTIKPHASFKECYNLTGWNTEFAMKFR